MIDFEEFEKYVKARCEKQIFVKSSQYITHEEILNIRNILKKYKRVEVLTAFECIDKSYNPMTFYVDTICCQCSLFIVKSFTKTKLIDYIDGKLKNICNECKEKNDKEEKEKLKIQNENNIQNKIKNTEIYINTYLNPNCSWNEGIKNGRKMQELIYSNFDMEEVSEHIKNMGYKEFLKTPYWKAIAEKMRYKANYKCQLCNSPSGLNVHHRTYENHGNELFNMQDLIVLCRDCHQKFHDIEEKE